MKKKKKNQMKLWRRNLMNKFTYLQQDLIQLWMSKREKERNKRHKMQNVKLYARKLVSSYNWFFWDDARLLCISIDVVCEAVVLFPFILQWFIFCVPHIPCNYHYFNLILFFLSRSLLLSFFYFIFFFNLLVWFHSFVGLYSHRYQSKKEKIKEYLKKCVQCAYASFCKLFQHLYWVSGFFLASVLVFFFLMDFIPRYVHVSVCVCNCIRFYIYIFFFSFILYYYKYKIVDNLQQDWNNNNKKWKRMEKEEKKEATTTRNQQTS